MSYCDINTIDIIVNQNDIDKIAGLMMDQYNLGVEATLNSQEEELLEQVTDKLNELFTQENMAFNPDGFKSIIKKLYPKILHNLVVKKNLYILEVINLVLRTLLQLWVL
jgi:hypothetical protein